MIKASKRAIHAILQKADVSDEELITAFTGAEALLNSRPLTFQSANADDIVSLTSNHFLHGQLGGQFAQQSVDETEFNPRKRWRRIQEIVRHFWHRWMRGWIPGLNSRNKWVHPHKDMQKDDVVIVMNPNEPRGHWPLGRVEEVYPGKDGHVRVVKLKVGGNRRVSLLKTGNTAPKILALKEGAPVILTRNLTKGLFNGQRGKVYRLLSNEPPVIDFDGKVVTLQRLRYEIYDSEEGRVLASRTQYPVILAFALTVHRAQGQTLEYLQIDCKSFFAAGQMGIAVGRATKKAEVQILNFNEEAAFLKHKDCVYEFYERVSLPALDNKTCCKNEHDQSIEISKETNPVDDEIIEVLDNLKQVENEPDLDLTTEYTELPTRECPFQLSESIQTNKDATFLCTVSVEKVLSPEFVNYQTFIYGKIYEILNSQKRETSQHWNAAYSAVNRFILSDIHRNKCQQVYKHSKMTNDENKLSTRLVMWLKDKEIQRKSDDIVQQQLTQLQEQSSSTSPSSLSSAGKAKLRYVAGCCLHKFENFHIIGKNLIDNNENLKEEWLSLFGAFENEDITDEIFIDLIHDLYDDITANFLKISLADGMKKFKEMIPRKKKQSLHSKLQALGEKSSSSKAMTPLHEEASTSSASDYICTKACEEHPNQMSDQSIGCDKCDRWFHYGCVNLTGKEAFLTSKRARWYCNFCSKKGKGTGKVRKM
ncbi:hypothetical protein FSP39_008246 [Pinctada imbricata]|uniref:PHD-type domain-containing protein n=1 Tax=Pinctada imbricata TaxID=66713 RepID=A0AA89C147_PINIB|nr:hypothetical protein FSP39_008246 [Pinctada imbricata]